MSRHQPEASGSIFLTWLYGSVLLCALWHATYNLVSGTAAGHGMVAAVLSIGVMVWAVVIVGLELPSLRFSRRAGRSRSLRTTL